MREICGVIVGNEVVEIRNTSLIESEFECDHSELYKLLKKHHSTNMTALFHTHPSGICYPSEKDIQGMKVWSIPWIIVWENCIGGFSLNSDGSVVQIDVHTLLPQELYNRLMELLH